MRRRLVKYVDRLVHDFGDGCEIWAWHAVPSRWARGRARHARMTHGKHNLRRPR